MKKVMIALPVVSVFLAVFIAPVRSLDWSLPVFTVRYEVAGGASEDPDDDSLEASSLRNTVSVHLKEESDPATLGLGLSYSGKDYYQQSGDYSYFKVEHDAAFRLGDPWKLGYTLGVKWMTYPEPDSQGMSKDALWLSAGATTAVKLAPGTGVEAGVTSRFALTDDPADARQGYAASAALSTRIGDWLLGARYRGEIRLPLGSGSLASPDLYHTASLSLRWDPN
jgi:hypothetical protein